MPEYIERDEILHRLIEIGGCDATDEWDKGYDGAIDAAISIVDCAPAADVVPVVHAAWIFSDDGCYPYCSNCIEKSKDGKTTSFCPNCGAKMIKSYLNSSITVMNTCVCCGDIIPEGRQVCPKCENK